MPEKPAGGVRARVRAELTAEIKAAARRQLATEGASSLSLRAIARELGMASSAIYRYFASRDELLTALIIDAYEDVASHIEAAESQCERADHRGRFVAIATTLRSWAVANPNEYALIYGTPVPGYAAPTDTIDPATRVPITLLTVLVESHVSETSEPDESDLGQALADVLVFTNHSVPADAMALAIEAWAEIFGLINLEMFGHFKNAVTNPSVMFNHAANSMAERILP